MKLKLCLLGMLCLFFRAEGQSLNAIPGKPFVPKIDVSESGESSNRDISHSIPNQITQVNKPIDPLKVGDILPELSFSDLVNHSSGSISLSDYRGKAIFIDFWATYCTSCLHHFPLEDSLQKEFGDKIQILLVDQYSKRETREKIIDVLKRFDAPGKLFSLPSIINDTLLYKLFPHFSIPHFVWIDQEGVVSAITSGEEFTRESMLHFLDKKTIPPYQKDDINPNRPLYTSEKMPEELLENYSIFLRGKIDGAGGAGIRYINNVARGIKLHKRSLKSMYASIANSLLPDVNERLILDVQDLNKLSYDKSSGVNENEWKRQNLFNYEVIVPAAEFKDIYTTALTELNRYTEYYGVVEKKRMPCWILEKKGNINRLKTKGGDPVNPVNNQALTKIKNLSMTDFIIYLTGVSKGAYIIDNTGIKENIDLDLKRPYSDFHTLKQVLQSQGLKLVKAYKDVEMLVIRDKYPLTSNKY